MNSRDSAVEPSFAAGEASGRFHHEYWPAWLLYLPLVPYLAWLALRYGGLSTPTCVNPGIEAGGGFVGERKSKIMRALGGGPRVLASALIEAQEDPAERAARVEHFATASAGGFPVILKPDVGQRGFAVRRVGSEAEARAYFATMRADALVQVYHPGPHEIGVVWARSTPEPVDGSVGFLYSVTRKEFPVIVGDGCRTLKQLILSHPRYRRQARVFLARLGEACERVPHAGEQVSLGLAGNHCQGALFRDGSDLITPALEKAIDELAASFAGGLDYGRFDLRYADEGELRRGVGFGVVELNGSTGEPTAMYDPRRGLAFAYGLLFGQWRLLFRLGARRRASGARPTSVRSLVRAWRAHLAERSGSAVSD